MKKPKYTRQTNYHVPKTHIVDKTTICEFEESIARNTAARKKIIKTPDDNKPLLSKKGVAYILRTKKHINKNLKGTKNILKSILRKSRNKSPSLFKRYHPSTTVETITIVQNSPIVVEYLEKIFTDLDNGPFKGLFKWTACMQSGEPFKNNEPRLCVQLRWSDSKQQHIIDNKVAAFSKEWKRVVNYGLYFFPESSLTSL